MLLEHEDTFQDKKKSWKKPRSSKFIPSGEDIITEVITPVLQLIIKIGASSTIKHDWRLIRGKEQFKYMS